jgi:hypothetical protein
VDGFQREPYVVHDVEPGEIVPFDALDVFCRYNRAVEVVCRVTVMYEDYWFCKREVYFTSYLTCLPNDAAGLEAQDTDVCAGIASIVPVLISNNGPQPESFTLECAVDGVALPPIAIEELAPGASTVVQTSMLVDAPGTFVANFTLISANGVDCLVYDDVDINLNSTVCAASGVEDLGLTRLAMGAYPNPVLGRSTTVEYSVPQHLDGSPVDLVVYDVTGRPVKHLATGGEPSGRYSVTWDLRDDAGTPVPAGVYFTSLAVGPERMTQRLLVMQQ